PGAAAGRMVSLVTQPYQPSPKGSSGRPAHRPFRGLLGVHSRYGLHTRAVPIRDTHSEGFSQFVTTLAAPAASGWSGRRVGLAPTGKRHLATAHTQGGHRRVSYLARISQTIDVFWLFGGRFEPTSPGSGGQTEEGSCKASLAMNASRRGGGFGRARAWQR